MLPLRKSFELKLDIFGDKFALKYLEATAEESYYFYSKTKNYASFVGWLQDFIDSLDSLTSDDKKKIMKWIHRDPEQTIQVIYTNLCNTRFRRYESVYSWVKSRPKPKWGGTIQGCSASTELDLSQATMIPIFKLNKELTLYQRGRLEDGLICKNLNTYKEGQNLNKKVWAKKKKIENPEKFAATKKKMDSLKDKLAALDSKKK